MCKRNSIFIFFFCILSYCCLGQDIQFSQFYANPLYLNPAFAGSVHQSRAIFHQRLQWPALEAKYITSLLSLDYYFEKYNSGIGVMVYKDWQGGSRIATSEIDFQYSYELSINKYYSFRAGFQGSYVSRNVNYNVLTFPDQFTSKGYTGQNTNEPFDGQNKNYLDLSVGGILYSRNIWAGITYSHINQPNQSFYDNESLLPYKLTFIGGYKIVLVEDDGRSDKVKEVSITPTFHYKLQGKSDQVDIGIYGLYHAIIGGLWYRGIPLFKKYNRHLQNNESFVILGGYKYHNFSISYSYDFTVSKLVRAITGGSHELNLTYVFDWPKQKRRFRKRLPCPHFR